ncbi:uncharacterized protein METZ01_LOCUS419948, partial [marine metagenome]
GGPNRGLGRGWCPFGLGARRHRGRRPRRRGSGTRRRRSIGVRKVLRRVVDHLGGEGPQPRTGL